MTMQRSQRSSKCKGNEKGRIGFFRVRRGKVRWSSGRTKYKEKMSENAKEREEH